jgi:hypothetical protein
MPNLFCASYLPALSDRAAAFLTREPTLIALLGGHYLYEDPVHGDEAPMFMITRSGKLKRTSWYDLPSMDEALDYLVSIGEVV